MGLDGEDTQVRVSLCHVLPSCVYEGLVGGGGMGLDGEDTQVRVSHCCVFPSCVYEGMVIGGRAWVWMGGHPG